MKFNFKNNDRDIFSFLNTPALEFYDRKHSFYDKLFYSKHKANLLSGLIDVERTMRGTFGCDFSMASADFGKINKMFPNVCKMLKIYNQENLSKMGTLLESLRNLNAHSFLSTSDIEFLKTDFSVLLEQKTLSKNIEYVSNGLLTNAGVIFLVLNFLRPQSISEMIKADYIVSVVASGNYVYDKGEKFVSDVSLVNLEIPIRTITGTGIIDSIFGEFKDLVYWHGNHFELSIGKDTYPTFKTCGTFVNNRLTVEKESLSRTFYKEDFYLNILYIPGFIELSNSLPPFALIDFLYETKKSNFDEEVYEYVKNEMDLLSKLNKPKFYADKKLPWLLYKSESSDIRIMSSVIVDGLLKVFLCMETEIYVTRRIRRYNKEEGKHNYSTIGNALEHIDVPSEIVTEIKYLRNFCAHGYILDDYLIYKGNVRHFTLNYLLDTLNQLTRWLKGKVEDMYISFEYYKTILLIDKILKTKYKLAVYFCNEAIEQYPNYDKESLKKKHGFITNSFFDTTTLNKIVNDDFQKMRVIEIYIPNTEETLYFWDNETSLARIDDFIFKNDMKIVQSNKAGLITRMIVEKN